MVGDESLGSQYQETIHLSSHHSNDYIIYDDVSLVVYAGGGIGRFRSKETSQSSSLNSGVYCCGDHSGDDRRCGSRYQKTNPYSFLNCGASFDGDGRFGYMSQTSHSTSHNPGGHGIFSGCSVASLPVNQTVCGYERGY